MHSEDIIDANNAVLEDSATATLGPGPPAPAEGEHSLYAALPDLVFEGAPLATQRETWLVWGERRMLSLLNYRPVHTDWRTATGTAVLEVEILDAHRRVLGSFRHPGLVVGRGLAGQTVSSTARLDYGPAPAEVSLLRMYVLVGLERGD